MTRSKRRRRRGGFVSVLIALIAALIVMAIAAVCIVKLRHSVAAKYPVMYTSEIFAIADENDIPAPYIAAVIMAESSYNPDAVSGVGAQGLMQIMPDTGAWIAGKLGVEYSTESIFVPETNIRYGAWYLGFLMRRYDGDMVCATAAYHAGQGTVDKWLKDPELSADGVTLSRIGYDSTDTYVKRVMKYYDYYAGEYAKLAENAGENK